MKELLKISENAKGEKIISARELHKYLANKRKFTEWIKQRIKKFGFIENQDYALLTKTGEHKVGGNNRVEYVLTLDTARLIALLERNEKGHQIRRYFISVEKEEIRQLSNHRQTISFAEALELAAKQQKEIEYCHKCICLIMAELFYVILN